LNRMVLKLCLVSLALSLTVVGVPNRAVVRNIAYTCWQNFVL
jgi:hypothetical protein